MHLSIRRRLPFMINDKECSIVCGFAILPEVFIRLCGILGPGTFCPPRLIILEIDICVFATFSHHAYALILVGSMNNVSLVDWLAFAHKLFLPARDTIHYGGLNGFMFSHCAVRFFRV